MTWVGSTIAAALVVGVALGCSRGPDATTASGPSPVPSLRDPALGEKAIPPGPVAARPAEGVAAPDGARAPDGAACAREGEECP